MDGDWQPMGRVPRDGTDVIVKSARCEVYLRVAWRGGEWMSGVDPVRGEFSGWRPMPTA